MTLSPVRRGAVLVIRVWREVDGGDLRIRISAFGDVGVSQSSTIGFGSAASATAELTCWLETFIAGDAPQTHDARPVPPAR